MKYLLDVNSLLALAVLHHEFHPRVARVGGASRIQGRSGTGNLSDYELGFVRVLSQAQQYGSSVIQARELLLKLKNTKRIHCALIPDHHDIRHLPKWVRSPKQTTDGHLVELAKANEAVLATLDRRIPGAFVVPQSRRS